MTQALFHLNEPLSPPRIGGIAAALAIHVAALMMLMAPMSYTPPANDVEELIIVPEDIKRIDPPLPPPIQTPLRKPELVRSERTPIAIVPPVTPPAAIYNQATPIDTLAQELPEQTEVIIPPPSGPISLSTEYAPAPKYPSLSLRNGEQGTVLLLVKVGADGRPIEVSLKKSSGYRELDKNAIKHVLATWRFHPAMHQGNPIPALALVPVEFIISN